MSESTVNEEAPPTPGPGVMAGEGKHDTRAWSEEERAAHRAPALDRDSADVPLVRETQRAKTPASAAQLGRTQNPPDSLS